MVNGCLFTSSKKKVWDLGTWTPHHVFVFLPFFAQRKFCKVSFVWSVTCLVVLGVYVLCQIRLSMFKEQYSRDTFILPPFRIQKEAGLPLGIAIVSSCNWLRLDPTTELCEIRSSWTTGPSRWPKGLKETVHFPNMWFYLNLRWQFCSFGCKKP